MADQRGDPPTEVPPAAAPEVPAPSPWVSGALVDYIEVHLDTYTPEALETALVAAGHDVADVRAAIERARARRSSGPAKARAQAILALLYALTYVVFVIGLLGTNLAYGASVFAAVILTVVMVVAFGASILFIRRRGAPVTILPLVFVPLLILVGVAGACYVTTGGAPLDYYRHLIGSPAIAPSSR